MDIISAITERQSTRAFTNALVPKEIISQILEIARFAPSGTNTQPWKVYVINGPIQKKIGDEIVAARDAFVPENPDYQYYPSVWNEPYKSRRKACGLALYSALNIKPNEAEKRKLAWYRNYYFFDAPIGLVFFLDKQLNKGSWLDMGMFIQSVMLAARQFGLDTCPEASIAEYPDLVRKILNMPDSHSLVCGMALGYKDEKHPINSYRTTREPLDKFTEFMF